MGTLSVVSLLKKVYLRCSQQLTINRRDACSTLVQLTGETPVLRWFN
ncbi:MAG: hypothetical protein SXA11_25465 [Cyanobacteriota bacterium]|nr:hypothetical protein [Cyanobacteriota bacterium]